MKKDDQHYIDLILGGEINAFSHLVNRHKDMVFAICSKFIRIQEDLEETTQDVFIKAYHSLNKYKGSAKFSTWLYRIAFNTAVSKTRKKKFEWTAIDEQFVENYSEDDIQEEVIKFTKEEQLRMLEQSLNMLSEIEQLIISLFYKHDHSVDEISAITNLSASNVKVKLFRIRNKILNDMSKKKARFERELA